MNRPIPHRSNGPDRLRKLWLIFICTLLFGGAITTWPVLAAGEQIHQVYCTNITDTTIMVSWSTDIAADGEVTYGTTTPPTISVTDPVASSTVHQVILDHLSPNTTYFFQVRSGTTTDNNSGNYYSCTTASTPGVPGPGDSRFVWGTFFENDGTTTIPNGLVYVRLERPTVNDPQTDTSQYVSARTNASGVWFFDLNAGILTADNSTTFGFTPGVDFVRLVGQGGSQGAYESFDCTFAGRSLIPAAESTMINLIANCPISEIPIGTGGPTFDLTPGTAAANTPYAMHAYTLTLTNNDALTDTFTVTHVATDTSTLVGANPAIYDWVVEMPADPITVGGGLSASIPIVVEIPANEVTWVTHTMTVTATSGNNGSMRSAVLTTGTGGTWNGSQWVSCRFDFYNIGTIIFADALLVYQEVTTASTDERYTFYHTPNVIFADALLVYGAVQSGQNCNP